MPSDLVLVRHGLSEKNYINKLARYGQLHTIAPEVVEQVRNQHTSETRLMNAGVEEARGAGAWLRPEFPQGFDRYYVSTYNRAMETAVNLGLPGARWYEHISLRERSEGDLEDLTEQERERLFPGVRVAQERNRFYHRPPNGMSHAEHCELLYAQILGTLHREMDGRRVIIVCHGYGMWDFRFLLERMSVPQWIALKTGDYKEHGIYNGQIFHYTRYDPRRPGSQMASSLQWFRTYRPNDPQYAQNGVWQDIIRRTYSNEELSARVEQTPRSIPLLGHQ